jgi:peptidoglycan/LPS O-acetylase OafA/YrhL
MNQQPVEPGAAPANRENQFSTVHALRGIAAFWVVLFHSYKFGALNSLHLDPASLLTRVVFEFGRGGVAMFFVISGFVIAHSLRESRPDLRFVGRFMLRRSVRLDPPYWVSIIVAVALSAAIAINNGRPVDLPGAGAVLAHVFYLQELLRVHEISVVYWTLTYEIQFYLVFVLALWAHEAMLRSRGPSALRFVVPTLLVGAALVAAAQTREWVLHGLFLNFWHAFVAGVLAYWGGVRNSRTAAVLLVPLAAIMLLSASGTAEVFNSPAALTALGLLVAGQVPGLLSRLRSGPLPFLGTISYSLYLLHVPAILIAVSLSFKLFDRFTLGGALAIFASTIATSLLVASVFWWAIERPSHEFAKKLKLKKKPALDAEPVADDLRPSTNP